MNILTQYRQRGDGATGRIAESSAVPLLAFAVLALSLGMISIAYAETAGTITTVAGNGQPQLSGDGGPASAASFGLPYGMTVDHAGYLYIADRTNNQVRKISPDGIITTVAGTGAAGFFGDGGPATRAQLYGPIAVVVDPAGNLLISDGGNYRVRKVSPDGIITTIAGTGEEGHSGDGGPALKADIDGPKGLALDAQGDLYVGEFLYIREIAPDGTISTVAGNGTALEGSGGDGLLATEVSIGGGDELLVDGQGNLIIADAFLNAVRRVAPDGTISTIAGGFSSTGGLSPIGLGDGGLAINAPVRFPTGLALDSQGNLYFCDTTNRRVRKIDGNGIITTVAGTGSQAFNAASGPATSINLPDPNGLAFGPQGDLFISDGSGRIWRLKPDGTLDTFAGGNGVNLGDGLPATQATLHSPIGLAIRADGSLLIADAENNRVRLIGLDGIMHTIAGSGPVGPGGGGYAGDGGPATLARLSSPRALILDAQRNLYVTDYRNYRVRKIAPNGTISAVAGTGKQASAMDGLPALTSPLSMPEGLAIDANNHLFIAENTGNRIRSVGPSGLLATIATVNGPVGMAIDGSGNIFVSAGDNTVQKIAPDGSVTVVAGGGQPADGVGDGGPATQAALQTPFGVAVDNAGNLFIAEFTGNRVRKVAPDGTISTVAGGGSPADGLGDGGPAVQARLNGPAYLAIDRAGNLYIADSNDNRVRRVASAAAPGLLAGKPFPPMGSGDVNGDGSVTVADAALALRFAVGLAVPTPAQAQAADIDGDGGVNVADAALILRKALGL